MTRVFPEDKTLGRHIVGLGDTSAYEEISMELTCSKCGKKLDAEKHFSHRKGTKTGYQYECKICRNKVSQDRRERVREEIHKKGKEGPRGVKRKNKRRKGAKGGSHKKHRENLLKNAGTCIADGKVIADTVRKMTFDLSLIFEQQLRLFYGEQIRSVVNKPKMSRIIEDAVFEFKEALGRASSRMRTVIKSESVDVDLSYSMNSAHRHIDALNLLDVENGATKSEIKKSYKDKASKAHPDHNGHKEEMQKLNEAFSLLMED